VANFINTLLAIRWVAQAWEKVNSITIKKFFRRAGILNADMLSVVSCEIEDDPFDDLDEDTNQQEVINQVNLPETCSVQEYTNADKDVPGCIDVDNSWEENTASGAHRKKKKLKKGMKLRIQLQLKLNL